MSGDLCGYVVRDSRPVADATVGILGGPAAHPDLALVTDSDGWFCLDGLTAGRWRLQAHAPDGSSAEATVRVWDDSLSETTLSLTRGGTRPANRDEPYSDEPGAESARTGGVVGLVTDAVTGRPVPGALVLITDGPGPLPDAAVTTDADGVFSLSAMPAGDWALSVDDRHGGHANLMVGVMADCRVDVTVVVRPGSPQSPPS